jgi:HIV Tat-specific factor 1
MLVVIHLDTNNLDRMATNRAPFPTNPDDFDSDTRISFSKTEKNYTLEDENGEEWEWFPRTSKWVPMVRNPRWSTTFSISNHRRASACVYHKSCCNDFGRGKTLTSSSFCDLDGRGACRAAAWGLQDGRCRRRWAGDRSEQKAQGRRRREGEFTYWLQNTISTDPFSQENAKKQKNEKKERINTAIYVTCLPEDVDEEELYKMFTRFGVIAEGIDDDKPRIKMYKDEDGKFNGDALIGEVCHN